jgi:UDP-N-acetylmuramoyl-L-alanyl-D-glutamate--2,6-diaminopimelate ligase
MFKEGFTDRILGFIKRFIPRSLFRIAARVYHPILAWTGALVYRFPSRKLRVIGVTGTKGKSSVVYLITQLLEGAGHPVAAIGSLGYKIRERQWPNLLKMTMPGRWKVQKFLRAAVDAGCAYVVMEVPSEGLAQGRHLGIAFDCAVFTNLHPEHLEAHGSFEAYQRAKGILFAATKHLHVLNADDAATEYFASFSATKKLFFGIEGGELRASQIEIFQDHSSFDVYGTRFNLRLGGRFNVYNALAALSVAALYGVDLPTAQPILARIQEISGRLQWIQKEPFGAVVDYAHTPESLRAVYETLRPHAKKLIGVLGAAGGGRDTWKRPAFGALAGEFCDEIYVTNEDPYNEDPLKIIDEVVRGIPDAAQEKTHRILDRAVAIRTALSSATEGDIVVITGKGSEISMAIAGDKKIAWSDADIVREALHILPH